MDSFRGCVPGLGSTTEPWGEEFIANWAWAVLLPNPARQAGTQEVVMKKLLAVVLLLGGVLVFAQDKSQITVKSVDKNNGVVLVTVAENGKTLELQCNEGASFCTAVKPGEYQMVRLPKNRGLYDCQNVDLFKPGADTTTDERLGQYCLLTN